MYFLLLLGQSFDFKPNVTLPLKYNEPRAFTTKRRTHEFRVGRLKHEGVEVPSERLLDWPYQVGMVLHADRKIILE